MNNMSAITSQSVSEAVTNTFRLSSEIEIHSTTAARMTTDSDDVGVGVGGDHIGHIGRRTIKLAVKNTPPEFSVSSPHFVFTQNKTQFIQGL